MRDKETIIESYTIFIMLIIRYTGEYPEFYDEFCHAYLAQHEQMLECDPVEYIIEAIATEYELFARRIPDVLADHDIDISDMESAYRAYLDYKKY